MYCLHSMLCCWRIQVSCRYIVSMLCMLCFCVLRYWLRYCMIGRGNSAAARGSAIGIRQHLAFCLLTSLQTPVLFIASTIVLLSCTQRQSVDVRCCCKMHAHNWYTNLCTLLVHHCSHRSSASAPSCQTSNHHIDIQDASKQGLHLCAATFYACLAYWHVLCCAAPGKVTAAHVYRHGVV